MTDRGEHADAFERCIRGGGIALFGADTVYGLAAGADNAGAISRLYALKRRPREKPSAVMFFDRDAALGALPELGPSTRDALQRLLPGMVTVLLDNPRHRYPLACGDDPGTLGLRVPIVPALAGVGVAVVQSSANFAGEPEARTLRSVARELRDQADLVIDCGKLPGTPSTVIDLRGYEHDGRWSIVRRGAVSEEAIDAALHGAYRFDETAYDEQIRAEIPAYDELQAELVKAAGDGARRILDLGTGTGETARRLLERYREATLVAVDEHPGMVAVARGRLPAGRAELRVGRLEDPLPDGPFDLVASALAVHHLTPAEKRRLFLRIREALAPGGRFVLGDVIVPVDPADAKIELTPGFDRPDSLSDLIKWLVQAGLEASVRWTRGDLAVLAAQLDP